MTVFYSGTSNDALYDDLDSRTLFNLNTIIQWIHKMAGNVRRWSECLTDLFEPGSEELGFVKALAEQPFKEIDVRCPAYAEILSKLVDVGELVDFGSSVGRRGQGPFDGTVLIWASGAI